MKFQDYYKTLDLDRSASKEQVSKSYRKLARKYHPDVSKESSAVEKFRQITEAYEVLKDPDKRKRYDALGENWKTGQEFTPPPGWEQFFTGYSSAGSSSARSRGPKQRGTSGAGANQFRFSSGEGAGGFSDFFNSLFSEGSSFGTSDFGRSTARSMGSGPSQSSRESSDTSGTTHHAELQVSLEDVARQTTKAISLGFSDSTAQGARTKSYQIKIPRGVTDGKVIRLAGQGIKDRIGGANGDLLLKIVFAKHPKYSADGHNLTGELLLSPWEAALGSKIAVTTLDGSVTLNVPAETNTGKQFRLKGKGLPTKSEENGDLLLTAKIVLPSKLTAKEKELFTKLQNASKFNPRKEDE